MRLCHALHVLHGEFDHLIIIRGFITIHFMEVQYNAIQLQITITYATSHKL